MFTLFQAFSDLKLGQKPAAPSRRAGYEPARSEAWKAVGMEFTRSGFQVKAIVIARWWFRSSKVEPSDIKVALPPGKFAWV